MSTDETKLIIVKTIQAEVEAKYAAHRLTRNSQQKDKILQQEFQGWTLDETLANLQNSKSHSGFIDPRNSLDFWARPPKAVRGLVEKIQHELLKVAPSEFYFSHRTSVMLVTNH